ncbi:hypothetical protein G5B46_06865 [Caulobacter sp. 602-2]|uniref:Uncharacterized protein n=1 Tax=Caulobacter sp. 602-2 TaxID=2710887 RepID=A0A6G4QV08_9CAUL|nr:hypothetical protein [Caulobacter sp. 602-2]NGM49323.1 hypothetical protein [Caulobacter sp. 602-2]
MLVELGYLDALEGGGLIGWIHTAGGKTCIAVDPDPTNDPLYPERFTVALAAAGLTIGQGRVPPGVADTLSEMVLEIAQPEWGPAPLVLRLKCVGDLFAPDRWRLLWEVGG